MWMTRPINWYFFGVRLHAMTIRISACSSLSNPSWWRHQMETFSALLALCAGNSPVTGEFPSQRPVTGNFGIFFDLRLNKRLSKQSWGWWFETPCHPLWCHYNGNHSSAFSWYWGRADFVISRYLIHNLWVAFIYCWWKMISDASHHVACPKSHCLSQVLL